MTRATQPSSLQEQIASALTRAVRLHHEGNKDEARLLYKGVVSHDPLNAIALCNLAVLLKDRGEVEAYRKATLKAALSVPTMSAAYNNLGNALRDAGYHEQSVKIGRYCSYISPFYADNYSNMGLSQTYLTDYENSIRNCRKCLILSPAFPDGWLNHANAMVLARRGRQAGLSYRLATLLRPNHHTTLSSFGVALASLGYLSEAVYLQEQALKLNSNNENAEFNIALYYLLMGRYSEGFKYYETGIGGKHADNKRGNRRRVGQPVWKGQPLTGKSIIVTAEQGIGDEIMFASVIPELSRLADQVYYEVTPRLYDLMRRSQPGVEVFKYNPESPREYLSDTSIDYSIPLGSLPNYFRKYLFNFGRQRPYLEPNKHLVRYFRHKYTQKFGDKFLIGVGWRGGSGQLRSSGRSTDLQRFAPIVNLPGVQAVSIQYGDVRKEIEQFNDRNYGTVHFDPEVDPLESIEVSVAQIAAMDLVVSVTNAGVHCAGALGVPCWILVPHISDWRWTWGRPDVIWYPGMRCYRQRTQGDWSHPFGRLISDLEEFFKGRCELRAPPAADMDWSGDL